VSKIKIFGLGGLSESGKNTYVIEVNDNIYIFDCGLKYANENLYGIDYIIPDFEYLIKNKKRIKGLFLTHAHYENMGATIDLVRSIPNLKVYATKFTRYILEQDGLNPNNIMDVEAHKKIDFGEESVFPLSVSHSCPDSVMYVLNTKDGAVCYTGDFIIDPTMMGKFDMDLGKIAYVGKKGVLALLCESTFSEHTGHTSPNHRLTNFFKYTVSHASDRMIFTVLPTHVYTLQDIFNGAENTHRKVVLFGKQLQNIVNFCIKENYLHIQQGLLGDLSNIEDKDSIIIMSDNRANPYANLSKVLGGYDKFIKLRSNDTIVFAEPRYDATEKLLVKLENDLAKAGCEIVTLPKDKLILHHASQEDLMLMIKLLSPKYYIPVKGEYRYMVNNANLAKKLAMKDSNIILKQNGEFINIVDGKLLDKAESIKVNDVLIDGKSTDDVGDLVIKDREMLSENGIVLISATISKKGHMLIVGPEVTTRGFIYVKDSLEMIKEIKHISEEVIMRNITDNYIDYNKIKTEIRDELGKYLYNETECKPMIIAVIQEV
jgi:ribonuclease J